MKVFKICCAALMVIALPSCAYNGGVTKNIDKPVGSVNATPIYNHAYNENYDSDKIDDIVSNAYNAYVLVDPFQDDVADFTAAIKANGNQVGAYISIGTGENWRDDFTDLKPYLVAKEWGEWEGEYFISEASEVVIDVMKARIDKIAAWGFDWVEFDNMDWVDDDVREEYGVEISRKESLTYFQELCDHVHQTGMKCMSKNTVEGAEIFDGVTYESYVYEKNWWDNAGAQRFLDAGKLVLIVHYNEHYCNKVYADYMDIYDDNLSFICEDANLEGFVHYNDTVRLPHH